MTMQATLINQRQEIERLLDALSEDIAAARQEMWGNFGYKDL
jgi:hypothetical protein